VERLPRWIEADAVDAAQLRVRRRLPHVWRQWHRLALEQVHGPGLRIEHPHAVVPGVGEVHVPVWADGEAMHPVEGRLQGRAAVAGVAALPGSGNGDEVPFRVDRAEPFAL